MNVLLYNIIEAILENNALSKRFRTCGDLETQVSRGFKPNTPLLQLDYENVSFLV